MRKSDRGIHKLLAYNLATVEAPTKPDTPSVSVESWSVSVEEIFKNADVRLDATHFDPKTAAAIEELQGAGANLKPLSDIASVELRSQFTRIWAQDAEHGLPYLNATDLLSLLALGVPAGGKRYLSHATGTNLASLIIRKGWLLMTCSGTIGRVFYVPKRLNGWAATHDLIRIIPKEDGMAGYLYAWLGTPVAQAQILSHTHGGQIDHVTDDQVSGVLVPALSTRKINAINERVIRAMDEREKAIKVLVNSWDD